MDERREAEAAERDRHELLYDLGCAFAARIELEELFPLVINKCCSVLDAEGASVLLLDPDSNELAFPYVAEENPQVAARLRELRFPADKGIAGSVLRSGKGVHIADVSQHPQFLQSIDERTGFHTREVLCAPLPTHLGVIGVLQVVNRRGGSFTESDLSFLEALAGSVAVAIENARLYARVKASEELLRVQVGALRRDMAHRDRFTDLIGTSPVMNEVFRLMESAAASPITVLIQGETGTGKELVARGIHRAGPRADEPFLAVNCAAVTETLLESELFGHRRGAFTGANQDHRGVFEAAAGGTIFLDEVGEMPVAMQAKLLRVLQEGEIVRVGETQARRVDVRIISATNRDLDAEVRGKAFREDLFYRLAVFPITLPPLRERTEDIPVLADHLLRKHRNSSGAAALTQDALHLLLRYDWPGNIRELENELERASVLAGSQNQIGPEHLSPRLRAATAGVAAASGAAPTAPPVTADRVAVDGGTGELSDELSLRDARARFEADHIRRALILHNRNVSHTARALGLSRVMLQKKMKEYGLRDE